MTTSETHNYSVAIRLATGADCRSIWRWRNEPAARAASFDPVAISYAQHERWFTGALADARRYLLVILDEAERPIGYARFQLDEQGAEISVALDVTRRKMGYGAAAIRAASDWLLRQGTASTVIARVKADNTDSVGAFRRAGFEIVARCPVADVEAYELSYSASRGE